MTRERDKDEPLPVAETAARWFTRLQDEEASGEDWLAFEQWLAASPEHAAAYERIEVLWVELDDMGEGLAKALDAPVSLSAHRAKRTSSANLSRRGWLIGAGALAASVAVAVVGVSNWPPTTETYEAAAGQTRRIVLSDGSRIVLNAGSRIDVRLGRSARRVEMAEGEAAFDVTHDPARPFLIAVGEREVRVVGTEFNLRQRGGDFALTVRRGVVEVRPAGAPAAAPTRVSAGHRLSHRAGSGPAVLTSVPADAAFAWTQGQLVYSDAPLAEVAADLSRSLGTRVEVADAATGRLRFTGVLVLDDRDAVLKRLEAFVPVRAARNADGIVLKRR